MAGAGKRTFIAGEVLTAAQVNDFLMDQAVMRFSGSAARAASITAPTEGMMTYLDDTNSVETFNGTSWVPVDIRRYIQAKGDLIVGGASASAARIAIGADGTVPVADSTRPGGIEWRTPQTGRAALFSINANNVSYPLTASLPAGFYRVSTTSTSNFDTSEFRFVAFDGKLYGVNLSAGAGVVTIPVDAASVNATKGATFSGLVEEIAAVTATLLGAPQITNGARTGIYTASFNATASAGATAVGVYSNESGALSILPTSGGNATVTPIDGGTYGVASLAFVQRDANGVWGTARPYSVGTYPYYVFRGNGTYVPPPGSTSAEVLLVAGGGGGGGAAAVPSGTVNAGGGGGGAGGAKFVTTPTPSPVSITVGGGGAGGTLVGTNGNNSVFGAQSSSGGGGGGGWSSPTTPTGTPGGSGGGGSRVSPAGTAGGTAVPGEGNNGSPGGAGGALSGGGGGKGAAGTQRNGGAGATLYGVYVAEGGQGIGPGAIDGTALPSSIYGGGGAGVHGQNPGAGRAGTPGHAGLVVVRPL